MNVLRGIGAAWAISLVLAACGGGGNSGYAGGNGGNGGMGTSFVATTLVSDTALAAYSTNRRDPNLVNGWGLAFNPQAYAWVANNGTATSTLYDGSGVAQSLVVTTPPAPTGIVYNGSQDFKITQGSTTAASLFIFATEGGQIAAWSPTVNATATLKVFDGSAGGSSYKGLAIASRLGTSFLYAADFHNARVDVFDSAFTPVHLQGAFTDAALPAGYAPFGIQAIGDSIYVAYAMQDGQAQDEVHGAGLGIVDVFDTAGAFVKRLVTGGALDAPWGIAMAPASFGPLGGALLVGNFGDGKINAFDPTTGNQVGTVSKADGSAIVIDGLWGIAFGNGINGQPTTTLFFAAGPGDEAHGVYGRIDAQ